MKKVILYIAVSLDGYIANKSNSVNWLCGDGSDNDNFGTYNEFLKNIDTVIMGYKTYNQIVTDLSPEKWVYDNFKSYVITSRDLESNEKITFTNELVDLIRKLKLMEGKNIWICGGATIVNQLIKEELIDEYRIAVIPTLLGGGVKLFNEFDKEIKLKHISTVHYNGINELMYCRRN